MRRVSDETRRRSCQFAQVIGRRYWRAWFYSDHSGGLIFIRDRIANVNRARRLAYAWIRYRSLEREGAEVVC